MSPRNNICDHPRYIHADLEQLSAAVAERWIALSAAAIGARGLFHVALSGGSTPKSLYRLLAEPTYRSRIDWSRTRLYFGDERAVPPDHVDSNFRMVQETLLAHVPQAADQTVPMTADPASIAADAARYAATLRERIPPDAAGMPVFDLVLLGMGPDGHTCSLFPDTPILQERNQPVAAVWIERLHSWRLSLTLPVLDAARQLLFLVAGRDKSAMLHRICHAPQPATPVPVERIRPRGEVEWHLDRAAAAALND